MNYSKGITRIWFALSLSWIFGVVGYHFDDINNPKIEPYAYLYNPQTKSYIDITNQQDLVRRLNKDKNYERYETAYRESYIYATLERKKAAEVMVAATLNDDQSIRKSQYNDARKSAIWRTIFLSIGPVIGLFLLGYAANWVSAGFRRSQPPKPRW